MCGVLQRTEHALPDELMRARNPYVGPVAFTSEDERFFFGRDDEASDLVSLIAAYPATLLYAASGAGKTSLLNAKVLPKLKAMGSIILGPTRVSGPAELAEAARPANVFAFYALHNLQLQDDRNLADLTLTEYLRADLPAGDDDLPPLRVLVLDQFEELFTSFPDRWEDRRPFFQQIGAALENNRRLRVLFSMREELVPRLEPYEDELPEAFRIRLRLERLRRNAALEAIVRPLESTDVSYGGGVAEKLADQLRCRRSGALGEFVEPIHLQIVCRRLWNSLPDGRNVIDADAEGDVEGALTEYYEQSIREIAAELHVREGSLRNRIETTFITPEGKRVPWRVIKGARESEDLFVEMLMDRHLIRQTAPSERASSYEISHDLLVEPILRSNQTWKQSQSWYPEYAHLEARASDWEKHGRDPVLLLDAAGVAAAETAIAKAREVGYDPPLAVANYLHSSEGFVGEEEFRRQAQWRKLIAAVLLGIVLFVFLAAWVLSSRQRRQMEEAISGYQAQLAHSMLAEGKREDALSLAVQAASKHTGDQVAQDARNALIDSIRALHGVWIPARRSKIESVRLSADGRRGMTATAQEICTWRTDRGTQEFCHVTTRSWSAADFSPTGTFLVAVEAADVRSRNGSPREFCIWKVSSGKEVLRLRVPIMANTAFAGDDRYLATVTSDGIRVYDLPSRRLVRSSRAAVHAEAVAFLRNLKNPQLAVAEKGHLTLFDLPSLRVRRSISLENEEVINVAIAPRDRYAVLETRSHDALLLVDLHSGSVSKKDTLALTTSEPMFVGDQPIFVLAGQQDLRYYRANDGYLRETHNVSSGGKTYGSRGIVVTVEPQNSGPVMTVYRPLKPPLSRPIENAVIEQLDVSADGQDLLTSSDKLAKVWSLTKPELQLQTLSLRELKLRGCATLSRLGSLSREVATACASP